MPGAAWASSQRSAFTSAGQAAPILSSTAAAPRECCWRTDGFTPGVTLGMRLLLDPEGAVVIGATIRNRVQRTVGLVAFAIACQATPPAATPCPPPPAGVEAAEP